MRALVLDDNGVRFDAARAEPTPGPGEVMVRPRRVLVTSTDVEVCRGLFGFRGVLGQAFAGEVVGVGEGADRRLIGRRVVASPVLFCGACPLCQSGLSVHCRSRRLVGASGADGALADAIVLPASALLTLGEKVSDDRAAFIAPLASAMQSVRQLRLEGKPYITVLGDGAMALLSAQIATRLNGSVRLVGRVPDRQALCEKWGVRHRHMNEIGRRADQDVVIDCTDSPEGFEVATALARPRGKVLLKSLHHLNGASSRADLTPVVTNELEVIGSFAGSVREALGVVERGEFDLENLVTRRMKLQDGEAIIRTASRPETISILVEV